MTQTLSLGPLSLLAEQHGPLLTITIHAPSDSAPVGKMTLTVPEWTALVALVDCMGAAEKRHAEDRVEIERLIAALTKISAIRDSIVGMQGFNFSEHAYPLVAALNEAGFEGAGYEISRANLGTLIEQRDAAETRARLSREANLLLIAERDSLRQQVRELTEENEQSKLHCTRWRECADNLRSDLSAALVSVDAMAKRLEQLQPIVSVLGDWDWAAIGADVEEIGTAHLVDDRALMSAVKALAHTAREQSKEGEK